MSTGKPVVVVTGVAGNLGQRLLAQLADFDVAGVDLYAPRAAAYARFERADLAEERSCRQLVSLLRETHAVAVVHLAFVIDPVRTGVLDPERMWQINVAGTARVMEAIAEVNRMGGQVRRFIFPSSVSAYGSHLPPRVHEAYPLRGHTLAYAIHKREADEVVRSRAPSLGRCSAYILRPHIFVGASVENYILGAMRGTPTGKGRLGSWLRKRGTRLPLVLPYGRKYLDHQFQFVHVDDMARLIVYLLRLEKNNQQPELTIMNVAGRESALRLGQCLQIAGNRVLHLPGEAACRLVVALLWKLGISAAPPESLPYILGSYTMDTSRLRHFLGSEYGNVIRYSNEDAFADSFAPKPAAGVQKTAAAQARAAK